MIRWSRKGIKCIKRNGQAICNNFRLKYSTVIFWCWFFENKIARVQNLAFNNYIIVIILILIIIISEFSLHMVSLNKKNSQNASLKDFDVVSWFYCIKRVFGLRSKICIIIRGLHIHRKKFSKTFQHKIN